VAHGQLGPVVYTPLISHQGLEQASKLFYSDGDLVQMFNQLDRLHEEMHSTVRSSEGRPSLTPLQTVETPDEAKFIREFGAELDRALALSRSYRKVWDTEDLVRAHRPMDLLMRSNRTKLGLSTTSRSMCAEGCN
jgi:hypothetical protein